VKIATFRRLEKPVGQAGVTAPEPHVGVENLSQVDSPLSYAQHVGERQLPASGRVDGDDAQLCQFLLRDEFAIRGLTRHLLRALQPNKTTGQFSQLLKRLRGYNPGMPLPWYLQLALLWLTVSLSAGTAAAQWRRRASRGCFTPRKFVGSGLPLVAGDPF
jgi:hypothetical protein